MTDSPGSGKTCVLLDLAKRIETSSDPWGLLFIKGDRFDGATSLKDLEERGLPKNIVGQLYFYEKSSDWVDKLTGEIAWKELRKITKKTLLPR